MSTLNQCQSQTEATNLLNQDLLFIFIFFTLNLSGRDPGIHLSNPITKSEYLQLPNSSTPVTKSSYSGYQILLLQLPNPICFSRNTGIWYPKYKDLEAALFYC